MMTPGPHHQRQDLVTEAGRVSACKQLLDSLVRQDFSIFPKPPPADWTDGLAAQYADVIGARRGPYRDIQESHNYKGRLMDVTRGYFSGSGVTVPPGRVLERWADAALGMVNANFKA